jgi:hypothetical protein
MIIRPIGDIAYLTTENVASFTNIGLSVTAPVTVTKWWTSNIFLNVYNNHYKGIYNNNPLDIAFTSYTLNINNSFTISKGLTGEIGGFYRARTVQQLNLDEPMYILNAAMQKQVLKGKATLRLNLRDPFWIMKYSGKTQYDIVDSKIRNKWDNRQVTASFTYRFGKTAQQQQQRRNQASQDEQSRVGAAQ